MEMSEIYNGSQWAHDIFLVNKAGATEYITGQSSTLLNNILDYIKCQCVHIKNLCQHKVSQLIFIIYLCFWHHYFCLWVCL